MRQEYQQYTDEHQKVWNILFDRQKENLKDKATIKYNDCLDELYPVMNADSIPYFDKLNDALKSKTGWEIVVVPGLIPAPDFLSLLAEKKFCSSTWLRSLSQLDYLEEPDMFHDIFGHIPLLMNHKYSDFLQKLGVLGKRHAQSSEVIAMLERFYWFTIEFGVINSTSGIKIYGAGILSSFQETNSIYSNDTSILPYSFDTIVNNSFTKSTLQDQYFALPNGINDMYASIDRLGEETNKLHNEYNLISQ